MVKRLQDGNIKIQECGGTQPLSSWLLGSRAGEQCQMGGERPYIELKATTS